MELTGRRSLAFDRRTVWEALNDPEVLGRSIPGCDGIDRVDAASFAVSVAAALGPVRAKFRGRLSLDDVVVPESYTLRFEGEGGAAGFAKGQARVTLGDAGGGTDLQYVVKAQVGGRIAQVGSRLVDSAALKLADDFFAEFDRQLCAGAKPAAAAAAAPSARNPWPMRVLAAGVLAALVAGLIMLLR